MSEEMKISIRSMRPEEKEMVKGIMKRSFPIVARWFFTFTPNILIAELNGQVQGAIVLKVFPLSRGRLGGLLYWLFVSPEVRDLGIGQKLIESGIEFLKNQGCEEIFGCVEGNNTSSSNLLFAKGFGILSPGQQFRRFGYRLLLVWIRIFHYIDIGHFLWSRSRASQQDNPALQWWGSLGMNTLLLLIALWRSHALRAFDWAAIIAIPSLLVIFFGGRHQAMRMTAKGLGLSLRYRAWESGFPLCAVLALVFAWWFPVAGSVYPKESSWHYRDLVSSLGLISMGGALIILTISWGFWLLPQLINLPRVLYSSIFLAGLIGIYFLVFDILMPFFPFISYNGRRIWNWNRIAWGVVAIAAVLRLVVMFID